LTLHHNPLEFYIMFTKSLIAAAITLTTFGTAFAQEATPSPSYVASSVSRAEVHAQAVAARQAGLADSGEATIVAPVMGKSSVVRAQVAAEAREALRLNAIQFGEAQRVITSAQLEQIATAGLGHAEATRVAAMR
jgi:hypothetical protein